MKAMMVAAIITLVLGIYNAPRSAEKSIKNPDLSKKVPSASNKQNNSGRFKLLWHIGPQLEELADPSPEFGNIIEDTQNIIDGYYFLLVNGGYLRYWPERPAKCALNAESFKAKNEEFSLEGQIINAKTVEKLHDECDNAYKAYFQNKVKSQNKANKKKNADEQQAELSHDEAVGRVFKNLSLPAKNSQKKIVVSEILVNNIDFIRKGNDQLKLAKLPWPLGQLVKNNIYADYLMTYHEPTIQSKHNTLAFPCLNNICNSMLDEVMLRELEHAFSSSENENRKFGLQFVVDIRRWRPVYEKAYSDQGKDALLQGILFEGGLASMSLPKSGDASNFASFAEGTSWLLKNTSKKIFFLIPNDLPPPKLDTELTSGIQDFVVALNERIRKFQKAPADSNPVCNDRIHFVPAGYGQMIHLRQFSSVQLNKGVKKKNTGLHAGTVIGELKTLEKLRTDMCEQPLKKGQVISHL
jgi:hypothetical protein